MARKSYITAEMLTTPKYRSRLREANVVLRNAAVQLSADVSTEDLREIPSLPVVMSDLYLAKRDRILVDISDLVDFTDCYAVDVQVLRAFVNHVCGRSVLIDKRMRKVLHLATIQATRDGLVPV